MSTSLRLARTARVQRTATVASNGASSTAPAKSFTRYHLSSFLLVFPTYLPLRQGTLGTRAVLKTGVLNRRQQNTKRESGRGVVLVE